MNLPTVSEFRSPIAATHPSSGSTSSFTATARSSSSQQLLARPQQLLIRPKQLIAPRLLLAIPKQNVMFFIFVIILVRLTLIIYSLNWGFLLCSLRILLLFWQSVIHITHTFSCGHVPLQFPAYRLALQVGASTCSTGVLERYKLQVKYKKVKHSYIE